MVIFRIFILATKKSSFNAGTAIAYGLSEEAALRGLTINPATILGIADRVGSLDSGKDATLFVSKGNAFRWPNK